MRESAASCPWRPQKAFTCGEPGPRESRARPHGRSPGEATAASAARPRALAGALSGRGHPLSPRECPRRPLTPARHLLPVTRGPLPPWSLELWGRAAGHWAKWLETRRPLRPDRPTAKDRGEAPRRWLFLEPRLASFGPRRGTRQAQGRQPHQKPPSGQRAPPRTYQARFTESLGSCPWNWKLCPPPRGPFLFPWTTLASASPTPAEAECQGRTRAPGPR